MKINGRRVEELCEVPFGTVLSLRKLIHDVREEVVQNPEQFGCDLETAVIHFMKTKAEQFPNELKVWEELKKRGNQVYSLILLA